MIPPFPYSDPQTFHSVFSPQSAEEGTDKALFADTLHPPSVSPSQGGRQILQCLQWWQCLNWETCQFNTGKSLDACC